MVNISEQLKRILNDIGAAEKKYHRNQGDVRLLAVSKTQSAANIRTAFNAGQKAFGENYLQEVVKKQHALTDLDIEWHFIGNIQSNKTKLIAQHFSWVQSVNRLSIAERLSRQRPPELGPLNICIEVNIDNDPNKSGVMLDALLPLANAISALPNLKLRGLMVIPQFTPDTKKQADCFQKVLDCQKALIQSGLSLDTLSMGMSADFETAIANGSTMVRIGTAIFGKREF